MPSTIIQTTSGDWFAEGQIPFGAEALVSNDRHFQASGNLIMDGFAIADHVRNAAAEGQVTLTGTARAHLDGEPDIDAIATGQISISGLAMLSRITQPFAGAEFVFDGAAFASNIGPEAFELKIILDTYLNTTVANYQRWLPLLRVGGVETLFASGRYIESDNVIGGELSLVMVRASDAVSIRGGASVEFGFAQRNTDLTWDMSTYHSIITGGVWDSGNQSWAWDNGGPSDSVSVKIISGATRQLGASPLGDVVIHDPVTDPLTGPMFGRTVGTDGREYPTTLSPVAGMGLHGVLRSLLAYAGFDLGTNIPDFRIGRTVVNIGQRYIDATKPLVGMFEPLTYLLGSTVWFIDTTIGASVAFPTAREIQISSYKTLSLQANPGRADAYTLQLIHNIEDFTTYITQLDDSVYQEAGNISDETYTKTEIIREWRVGHQNANPFIVISQDPTRETRTITNQHGVVIHTSVEVFNYTAKNQIDNRVKMIQARVPDLVSWNAALDAAEATLRAANPDISDQDVDDALSVIKPDYSMQPVFHEVETYSFAPYPLESGREYLQDRNLIQKGYVTIDDEGKHLGRPFKQAFMTGLRSGNLKRHVTLEWGNLRIRTESAIPRAGGMVDVNFFDKDYITDQVVSDRSQSRVGDIATKTFVTNEVKLLIYDGFNSAGGFDGVEQVSFGSLPVDQIIPLAKRKLEKRRTKPRTLEFECVGFDSSLLPGTVVRAVERSSIVVADVIIVGRTISFGYNQPIMTTLQGAEI